MRDSNYFVIWLSGILVIVLDQLTKIFATNKLHNLDGVYIFETKLLTIGFRYTLNKFLAFSIPVPQIVIIITSIVLIILLGWLLVKKAKQDNFWYSFGLVVLISAAISNLTDRIVSGAIVDFVLIKILNFQWGLFNVADAFITLSIFFILYLEFRKKKDVIGNM